MRIRAAHWLKFERDNCANEERNGQQRPIRPGVLGSQTPEDLWPSVSAFLFLREAARRR